MRSFLLTVTAAILLIGPAAFAQTPAYRQSQSEAAQYASQPATGPTQQANPAQWNQYQRERYLAYQRQQYRERQRQLWTHPYSGVYNNGLGRHPVLPYAHTKSLPSAMLAGARDRLRARFNPQNKPYGKFWQDVEDGVFGSTVEDFIWYAAWVFFIGGVVFAVLWHFERNKRYELAYAGAEIVTFFVEQNRYLESRANDAIGRYNTAVEAQERDEVIAANRQLAGGSAGRDLDAPVQPAPVGFDPSDSRSVSPPTIADVVGVPKGTTPATGLQGLTQNSTTHPAGDSTEEPTLKAENRALRKRLEAKSQQARTLDERVRAAEARLQKYEKES